MYAILDIETTGGAYNEEGITEIAIYQFDGHDATDQFISLINPEIPIQPFVVKLTGINNAMLRSAPKFYEVAKRILEITQGCTLVAHNASFDYRILQMEFARLGYPFEMPTLCTVELAKKTIPDMPSYSLGKLVRSLGIPITDRHRASGDALATLKLFQMILAKDTTKSILSGMVKEQVKKGISPKLLDILAELTNETGIYYIHNEKGTVIYIGKSKSIKKRVTQHFTGSDRKSVRIQAEVYTVTFEETGSELIALLKESQEIKVNKPIYNRAQRKSVFPWGIYLHTPADGYWALYIEKIDGRKHEMLACTSIQEAKSLLFKLTGEFGLCQKINGLYDHTGACFQFGIRECAGACIGQEPVETYNQRVQQLIDRYGNDHESMILIDRGRYVEERSAVWIENGVYKGYCFYDLNFQIHRPDILRNLLIPMENNRDTQRIIRGYLRKNKVLKVLPLMQHTDPDA